MKAALPLIAACLVFPSVGNATRIEAESFTGGGTVVTGLNPTATSGGAALRFDSAGSASRTFDSAVAQLNIVARGGSECATSPTLTVSLDGRVVLSSQDSTTHWVLFKVAVAAPAGTHTLSVAGPDAGCGRPRFDYVDLKAPAPTAWRPFTVGSPWNQRVTVSTSLTSTQVSDLGGNQSLDATGTPSNPACGSPLYFAKPGDPQTSNVSLTTDWSPNGDFAWDHGPIPIPPGTKQEACGDGHLAIVSADRRTGWDFWGVSSVSSSAVVTKVIAQVNLTGPGYATPPENSARGSGVPLIDTSVRCEEVLNGIFHAIGITVPGSAGSPFVAPPASHSDGSLDSSHLRYGQRVVLRPDYPRTGTVGQVNVIIALQTYGAFVVDQGGGNVELDAFSPVDPAGACAKAGFGGSSLQGVHSGDFRLATATVAG